MNNSDNVRQSRWDAAKETDHGKATGISRVCQQDYGSYGRQEEQGRSRRADAQGEGTKAGAVEVVMAEKKRTLPPWLAKKGDKGDDKKKGKGGKLKDKAKKKGGFVPFKKKGK